MPEPTDLSHVIRPLPSGGEVWVLDTGALINPEAQAMIGAMYSRSAGGIRQLIERLRTRGPGIFLRQNYQIGYGHKSIGDLGEAAIFIDGVSMLAAKAIQDFPLYRGQESSTRYIDFSKQPFMSPAGERGIGIQEMWRAFYVEHRGEVEHDLVQRFPRQDGEDEKAYEGAIRARGLDIMRGFLPAGALTNVAWIGDLRHVNDHLMTLRHHPLEEVRDVALAVEDALAERFPDSFDPKKRYMQTEAYLEEVIGRDLYLDKVYAADFCVEHDGIDPFMLVEHEKSFFTRPPKTELPYAVRDCGTLRFGFMLDFGSYRDLQRQRAVAIRMPLLSGFGRFEAWYLDELPSTLGEKARGLVSDQLERMDLLHLSPEESQYYLPMGTKCPICITGDLRAFVYLVELRATRFVHPTLRRRAIQMAEELTRRFGKYGLVLHLDEEPNRFDVRRGTHDIVERT